MEKDDDAQVVEDPKDRIQPAVPEPEKSLIGEYMNKDVFSAIPKSGNSARIIVTRPYETVAIDLMDMSKITKYNDGYAYDLVCTDVFSRFVYHHLLKAKTTEEIHNAFENIFNVQKMPIPDNIFTDKESGVWSKTMKKYFEERGICLYHNGTHAVPAEVSIKRIKKILYLYMYTQDTNKWYDVIDRVVAQTNSTVIKSVGLSPTEMLKPSMFETVRDMFLNPQEKKLTRREKILWEMLDIGSQVLMTREKGIFEKGYDPNFGSDVCIVTGKRKDRDGVPLFYIKYADGEEILNGFYAHELMPIDPETHKSIYPTKG